MTDTMAFLHQAFRALTDHGPLRWQQRLFERLLQADIPSVCNIPTGLGKTSVIPIWLIALAAHADQRRAGVPRRLVYIVNRRTVVDQATSVVELMCQRLFDPNNVLWSAHAESLRLVARLLRGLAATEGMPLAVSTLRGELADNQEWKADPARPAIIIGTIDMVGSKLLFSGYGDGRYGRAHHAGLIGQDTLIVHDEAHLTPAFSDMLHSVANAQQQAQEPRPIRIMELSATARGDDEHALQLDGDDEEDAIVKQRLDANKRLHLYEVSKADIRARLVELAGRHEQAAAKVLVYVRSPQDVQKVAEQLKRRLGRDSENRVALLTGTIRGHERDQVVKANPIYRALLDHRGQPAETMYLVSTSAGEVGIDLDADHIVCDLTTLDSMIQRLGRVNRCGGEGRIACVDVVAEKGEPARKGRISRLEPAIQATKTILQRWVDEADGVLDASPRSLRRHLGSLPERDKEQAFSPKPPVAPLTDILLDAWSLTTIAGPMPGRPHVAAYLHGLTDDPPETFVAWRSEVALLAGAGIGDVAAGEWFSACRIEARERLRDRTDRVRTVLADLLRSHRKENGRRDFPVVLLGERGEAEQRQLSQIVEQQFPLAYRTIVLPVEAGGLSADGMLDSSAIEPTAHLDIADEPGIRARRVRRVQPGDGQPFDQPLIELDMAGSTEQASGLVEQHQQVLHQSAEGSEQDDEARYLVLMASTRQSVLDAPETTRVAQRLTDHLAGVARQACQFADALGLEPSLKEALVKAGAWHDCGKKRLVWQRYACNPDPGNPLAKSTKYRPGWLLGGYRHEFGSLLDATVAIEVSGHPERDLILHLVGAHHGWARPHFEPKAHDPPPTTTRRNEETAVEAMRRFGRLQHRFGRWGLAWLESLLRSADILASQNPSNDSEVSRW